MGYHARMVDLSYLEWAKRRDEYVDCTDRRVGLDNRFRVYAFPHPSFSFGVKEGVSWANTTMQMANGRTEGCRVEVKRGVPIFFFCLFFFIILVAKRCEMGM